jgi:hypothetical protein
VATAYWAVAAVHLLAIPAYPFAVAHGLATPWQFPATRLLQALMLLSAVLASSVNLLNIYIIAKAGPGVLAVGSAMSIPIAYAMDFVVHGDIPAEREITGCIFIVFALSITLSRPDLTWGEFRRVTVRFTKQLPRIFSADLLTDEDGEFSPLNCLKKNLSFASASTAASDLEAPLLADADGPNLAAAA